LSGSIQSGPLSAKGAAVFTNGTAAINIYNINNGGPGGIGIFAPNAALIGLPQSFGTPNSGQEPSAPATFHSTFY